ncbi:unnamed protein product, partial [marine sediment metagenome]
YCFHFPGSYIIPLPKHPNLKAHQQYPVAGLISIGSSMIFSVSDKSAAIVPTINYYMFENVDLTLMLNFYIGDEGKVFSSTLGNGGFIRAQVYF